MLALIAGIAGGVLVIAVLLSVLRTVFIPRFAPARITRSSVWIVAGLSTLVAARLPRRAGDRVMDLCAPLALFVMATSWLVIDLLGFFLLGAAVHGSVLDLTAYPRLLVMSPTDDASLLVLATWLSILLILAAFIIHILRVTDAYSRRERLVTSLASHACEPLDAEQLVADHLRVGSRDILDTQFKAWLDWMADVHGTHSGYPALVYYRSVGQLSWLRAAVIMLDAAALTVALAPTWAPPHTLALLHRGALCLQGLARYRGVTRPSEMGPVSLQGREDRAFQDAVALVVGGGLPAETDLDQAWCIFQRERNRYAPYSVLLESRLLYDRVDLDETEDHCRGNQPHEEMWAQ